MESFSLREATIDDVPAMVAIENQVHVAPWTEENFRSELAKPYSKTYVLTDDETDTVIAAYIVFWHMYEECQILNLAVALPYRSRGYAQLLVRKTIDFALKSGAKRLLLDVRKGNIAAVQLYQKLHFTTQHLRKAFYSNGEDAYAMVLPIDQEEAEWREF
ncbi:MAG: ribosomal protein S18-alanine N-acetyltransferase [Oligoflexia bacterium]|nr:ribosomal protein S18-alanine N-acetyltransferase [Oligoflexia bacterium]